MDENERVIAEFLKPPGEGGAYTDERLAMLLAHAQDGKLSMYSCCCLRGVPSADHALRGSFVGTGDVTSPMVDHPDHFRLNIPNEPRAEQAFYNLSDGQGIDPHAEDATRRAKLIPLILAEMNRRINEPVTCESRDNDLAQELSGVSLMEV